MPRPYTAALGWLRREMGEVDLGAVQAMKVLAAWSKFPGLQQRPLGLLWVPSRLRDRALAAWTPLGGFGGAVVPTRCC